MPCTFRHPLTRIGIVMALLAIAALAWRFSNDGERSLTHRFVVGQRLVYRLEYLSASAANFNVLTREDAKDADQNEQSIFTTVEANLEATVLEAHTDGAVIAFAFRKPEVQVIFNDNLAVEHAEAIQADLSRTLLATIDRHGDIRSVQLDPQVIAISHTFVRTLLATTQVALPGEATQSTWEAREGEPNGEYVARYTLGSTNAHIAVFTKERIQYVPRPREHSIRKLNVESVAQPSGNLTVHFDLANGRVESLAGKEATSIVVEDKVVARGENTVKMILQRSETLAKADLEKLRRACASLAEEPAVALSAPAPRAGREASIHRNELGEDTLESLLADLKRLDAKADPEAPETRLYLKLKALIYLQPEVCPTLAKLLSTATIESRTMPILTEAFSSVGHAEAQKALQSAIKSRSQDEPALATLVSALAMVETPTETSEEVLRTLAANSPYANIRAGAELGLGTMAHQLALVQPHRTARIVRAMAVKLAEAKSSEERRHCLFVLGNAGASESLEAIKGYVSDPSAEVRAAAVAALRWIGLDEADGLLGEALAKDTDLSVRIEATTSLSFRVMTPATFAVQKNAFLKDASTSVRLAVLTNLARARSAFPEARSLLNEALNDQSQEVREEAGSLLSND